MSGDSIHCAQTRKGVDLSCPHELRIRTRGRQLGRREASESPPITPDIRSAAVACFADGGYHGTIMNDIAEAIGIRPSSLYNHMPSTQTLFQAVVSETMTQAVHRIFPGLPRRPSPPSQLEIQPRRGVQQPNPMLFGVSWG
ncbi:TetR/AcrR family transcriptional regulator [Rhodococcus sp. T7]|uniref:TetR/AcrR family transcriptional regulator n=1 Tax=Rhodococcus sp. T7 TaxID=627444 RepID=UPI003FA6DB08